VGFGLLQSLLPLQVRLVGLIFKVYDAAFRVAMTSCVICNGYGRGTVSMGGASKVIAKIEFTS